MPQLKRAAYLRERAANFHRLAKDYDEAGNHPVCAKLTQVAADLQAQAAALEAQESGRAA
jgi:hypothetical protein